MTLVVHIGKCLQPQRLLLVSLLIVWHVHCRPILGETLQEVVIAPSNNNSLPINISISTSISKLPHQLLLWGDNLLDKLAVVYSMYSGQNVSVNNDNSKNSKQQTRSTTTGIENNEMFNGIQSNLLDFSPYNGPSKEEKDEDSEENTESELAASEIDINSALLEDKATYPGELGSGVTIENLDEHQEKLIEQAYEKFGFNELVSNLVPYNRSLPDFRNEWCQRGSQTYPKDLPRASIIITFYNEAKSTLLRSLYSILERTDGNLLEEILLINDFSQEENFGNLWLESVLPVHKIRIINTLQKEGVARARTLGAINAKGPVLVFLDSHVEVTQGWLEPLLQRISLNEKLVVAPTVDVIDANSFRFKSSNSTTNKVGVFDWSLQVKQKFALDSVLKIRSSPADPVQSAVIPFGMFAIHKDFFKSLGYFDTNFIKWGGEALELSFKTWMCNGKIEISPCSHVGHVFKGEQQEEHKISLKMNLQRVATNWLGKYASYYYEMASSGADGSTEDISDTQTAVKFDLQCKPFSWYLENIAPEVFNPELSVGEGEVRNGAFGWYFCMDASSSLQTAKMPAGVWPCHQLGGHQYRHYSSLSELRRVDLCMDYSPTSSVIIMYYCDRNSKTQKWLYDYQTQQLHHPSTSKCLEMNAYNELLLGDCNSETLTQKWIFGTLNEDRLWRTLKNVFNVTDSIT